MKTLVMAIALILVLPAIALAQQGGWTIQTPGQLPTFVRPNMGGGYTVQTPGQLPTFIRPNMGGGYTVQTPGQLPTFITPAPGSVPTRGYNPPRW